MLRAPCLSVRARSTPCRRGGQSAAHRVAALACRCAPDPAAAPTEGCLERRPARQHAIAADGAFADQRPAHDLARTQCRRWIRPPELAAMVARLPVRRAKPPQGSEAAAFRSLPPAVANRFGNVRRDFPDAAARLSRPEVTKRPDFTHKRTKQELRRPCERYRAQP
jgi:hypothetical protein